MNENVPQRRGPPLATRGQPTRMAILAAVVVAYTGVFALLHPLAGDATAALSFLPIVLAAYLFGTRVGLATAVAFLPLHQVLFSLAVPGHGLGEGILEGLVALVATAGSAAGVGWLRATLFEVHRLRDEVEGDRDRLEVEVDRREAAERQARQRHRVLEAAMESAPLVIVTVDEEGGVLQDNLADHLEIPGRDVDRDAIAAVWPGLVGALDRALEGERFAATLELAGETWEVHGHPLDDEQGPGGATVIAFDVTDWRRATQARKDAQLEAERASQMKSAFLANTSHEIRTPMTAILGTAQLLETTELSEEQLAKIETIKQSGDHLIGLINDILDLSKIEAGQLEVNAQEVVLSSLVETAVDMVDERARRKGLAVSYEIDPSLPDRVKTDPERFRQILTNLLSNAVKYTNEGQVEVSVEPAGETEPGTVAVAVRDSGIGIPEGRRGDLFDAFTQVNASVSRPQEGVGLGLSIARELSHLLGGQITCESTPDVGSTFRFTVRAPAVEAPGSADGEATGRPVVVASDDPFTLDITHRVLDAWDREVIACRDPDAVRDLVDSQRPALVLVDEVLGSRPGIQLAREIRRHAPEGTLTVFVTSTPDEVDVALDAVLAKPVSASSLHDLVFDPHADLALPSPNGRDEPVGEPREDGIQVLVAEDNPVNRDVLVTMTEKLGHHVTAVADGREAVEAVQASDVDLVLMDIQMPEMDGYEAAERILGAEGTDVPRIVAVTANADEQTRQQCLDAGMQDRLAKPVTFDVLEKAVQDTLLVREEPDRESHRALVDPDRIEEVRSLLGGHLTEDAADRFADEGEHQIERAEQALERGDRSEAIHAIHALMGQSATFGAHILQNACEDLHRSLQGADADERDLAYLRRVFTSTCRALEDRSAPRDAAR